MGLAPCWPMGEDKSAEQAEVPMTVHITDNFLDSRHGLMAGFFVSGLSRTSALLCRFGRGFERFFAQGAAKVDGLELRLSQI